MIHTRLTKLTDAYVHVIRAVGCPWPVGQPLRGAPCDRELILLLGLVLVVRLHLLSLLLLDRLLMLLLLLPGEMVLAIVIIILLLGLLVLSLLPVEWLLLLLLLLE